MSQQNQNSKIVGLYGLPGAGKTTLKDQLQTKLGNHELIFLDGSDIIDSMIEGGLDAFKKMDDSEKTRVREHAIAKIKQRSVEEQKTAVVTGHFSFWSNSEKTGKTAWTSGDANTYDLIIYLEVEPGQLHRRIELDSRDRQQHEVGELQAWQDQEIRDLRKECYANKILFTTIPNNESSMPTALSAVSKLLRASQTRSEAINSRLVAEQLDKFILQSGPEAASIDAALIFDGDKTLSAEDTGELYWNKLDEQAGTKCLRAVFQSAMGYSYAGICQAALLYDQTADEHAFQSYCDSVAHQVMIRPEFERFITSITETQRIKVFVVTCGLQRIWNQVVALAGLADHVKVIGSGKYSDDFVVTPTVKAEIVEQLRKKYEAYVWAFGDGETDIPMLRAADEALIVIGGEERAKSTMSAMRQAVDSGLRSRQLITPGVNKSWLEVSKVPATQIDDLEVAKAANGKVNLLHTTERAAAKLLMTPSRDADIAGVALRQAHFKTGEYLATELLSEKLGLQYVPINHVTGGTTEGYRIFNEDKTSIVALMRGGEPMAFGVNAVLPRAMFVHAKGAENLRAAHLQGQATVILVDSVINNGETVIEFVKRVRALRPTIQIVVVTAVAQQDAVKEGGTIEKALEGLGEVTIVALRVSGRKYTGRGKTDTGARLFNTTEIEK